LLKRTREGTLPAAATETLTNSYNQLASTDVGAFKSMTRSSLDVTLQMIEKKRYLNTRRTHRKAKSTPSAPWARAAVHRN